MIVESHGIVRRSTPGCVRVLGDLQPFAGFARFEPATQATLCSSLRRGFRLIAAVLDNVFRVSLDPGVRQERLEIHLVGCEGDQQGTHIGKRFDQVPLRAGQNAQADRRCFAATITSEK